MALKRALVQGLDVACQWVDDVAYRPAVVRLTLPLPRWWHCELAQLSMRLDQCWGLGYWDTDESRTLAPGGLCDVCHRRPANLEYGGLDEDYGFEAEGTYMEAHPLKTCFWCKPSGMIESDEQLAAAVAEARAKSISWRWRWQPGGD